MAIDAGSNAGLPPGTTVDLSRGMARLYGGSCQLIDTPGTLSLPKKRSWGRAKTQGPLARPL